MEIALSPELEGLVAETVAVGDYATPGEAVRAGLNRLLGARLPREELRARFEQEIRIAIDQLDHGDGVSGADVLRDLAARIEARRRP